MVMPLDEKCKNPLASLAPQCPAPHTSLSCLCATPHLTLVSYVCVCVSVVAVAMQVWDVRMVTEMGTIDAGQFPINKVCTPIYALI